MRQNAGHSNLQEGRKPFFPPVELNGGAEGTNHHPQIFSYLTYSNKQGAGYASSYS